MIFWSTRADSEYHTYFSLARMHEAHTHSGNHAYFSLSRMHEAHAQTVGTTPIFLSHVCMKHTHSGYHTYFSLARMHEAHTQTVGTTPIFLSRVYISGGSREVPGFPWNPPFSKKLTTSSYNGSAAEAVTLHCNRNFASQLADSAEMHWACPVLWDFP